MLHADPGVIQCLTSATAAGAEDLVLGVPSDALEGR